jgi:hypothetical protein
MAGEKRIFRKLGKVYILTVALVCILSLSSAAEDEKLLIGDKGDGTRARPVHIIPVLDENAEEIAPTDDSAQPLSIKETCGECHSYDKINKGWHFNYLDPNVLPGRAGQPWIYVDQAIGTQIPISYRSWPGTFKPQELGLTSWQFTLNFGRHIPGGGAGAIESENPEEIMRQFVSGNLEINCLSCHNAGRAYDQTEYAGQIKRENFRWATTAACGFASMEGSAKDMPETYDPLMGAILDDPKLIPPAVTYREVAFDEKNKVHFDIEKKGESERCYFCHSNKQAGKEVWESDEDVHLAAGLKCADCHRNGLDHNIVRGYEGESDEPGKAESIASLSCSGCHLPGEDDDNTIPTAGRLGAPKPLHKGIPEVHFRNLTCTACHSGPWPGQKTGRVKTSRAHALGTRGSNKSDDALPHIVAPVFSRQDDGKIGVGKLIWPAYWASLKDDKARPIDIAVVQQSLASLLSPLAEEAGITKEQITAALQSLSGAAQDGKPVYIAGGVLYKLDENKNLIETGDHEAAKPYIWPLAHDVRGAQQALGARGCEDCHNEDSVFFAGQVEIDTFVKEVADKSENMFALQGATGPVYVRTNKFFKWLIIITMSLLILHIMGDLFRRGVNKLSKK